MARRVALLDQRCEEEVGCELASSNTAVSASSVAELTRCFIEVIGGHTQELWDASGGSEASDRNAAFRAAQCWIAHGPHLPPAPEHFVPAPSSPSAAAEKLRQAGLYTSTRTIGLPAGMWLTYLAHGIDGGLFPTPWTVYSIVPPADACVFGVTSASEWEGLVHRYGVKRGRALAPDWPLVAADYDAVHMTARAVLATQGLQICTDGGYLVAPYWDIESTLWSNWRFDRCELMK